MQQWIIKCYILLLSQLNYIYWLYKINCVYELLSNNKDKNIDLKVL